MGVCRVIKIPMSPQYPWKNTGFGLVLATFKNPGDLP